MKCFRTPYLVIVPSAVLDGQRDERAGRLHPRPQRGDQGAARGVAIKFGNVMLQGAAGAKVFTFILQRPILITPEG